MNRREVLTGLIATPVSNTAGAMLRSLAPTQPPPHPKDAPAALPSRARPPIRRSGAVTSCADGQLIADLDIDASIGNGVTVRHKGVTLRNCRIRHAAGHGLHAEGAAGLVVEDVEIVRVGATHAPLSLRTDRNNVNLEGCPNATITRLRASRGSCNIYVQDSAATCLRFVELHDVRGLSPRGQNVQFNRSPDSILEDFSAENGPTSWTEDNVSIFRSDRCIVRRGLVSYNNSPTGDGVMVEGAFDCTIEEVDAVEQGNGAFAAVPTGEAGCGGCRFLRCRTRDSYNTRRDGRPAPSSNSLSFYVRISAGAPRHTIAGCEYDRLANPANLIWDLRAVNGGWSFSPREFAPRAPIRLPFAW